ncbi:TPA: site-specific integrase [Klebsiella oxytoca]|nr:site-specific integrase [Klebsiella oxytoca]
MSRIRIRPLSFNRALARYCNTVSRFKKGHSQEVFRINVLSRAQFAKKALNEITSVEIAAYRDDRLAQVNPRTGKTLSPDTIRLEMALMSDLFDVACNEWGACRNNPVARVRRPRPSRGRERRLHPYEERKLLRGAVHINPQMPIIVTLAIETAMRQGELLSLRWEDINLSNGVAHLPDTKNGHPRDVPLSRRARRALQDWGVRASGPVFSYTSNGVKSAWRRLMQRTQIAGLRFHDLRHEAISRLVELGTLDILEVAAISGHRSLTMLKRYTHLKAHRLVSKLEGGRRRVLSVFVPYPAQVSDNGPSLTVTLPDFPDLVVQAGNLCHAAHALLHHLAIRLRDGRRIPPPSQIGPDDNEGWLMIDPLAGYAASGMH